MTLGIPGQSNGLLRAACALHPKKVPARQPAPQQKERYLEKPFYEKGTPVDNRLPEHIGTALLAKEREPDDKKDRRTGVLGNGAAGDGVGRGQRNARG